MVSQTQVMAVLINSQSYFEFQALVELNGLTITRKKPNRKFPFTPTLYSVYFEMADGETFHIGAVNPKCLFKGGQQMTKLDKVSKALTEKINSTRPATFAIYMDYEFYSMCKMELLNTSHKPMSHLDFLNEDMLFGHPVYRVVSVHGREGLIAHPDFVIYRIV